MTASTERRPFKELADIWPALERALGGLKGVIYDDMPKPASKERHLPINAAVSDLIAEIRDWVAYLARTLRKEREHVALDRDTESILRHLDFNAEWFVKHAELHDAPATTAEYVDKAMRMINPGHRKARMPGCRQPGCAGTYTADNGRLECSTSNPLHTVNITRPPTINEAALTRLRQSANQR